MRIVVFFVSILSIIVSCTKDRFPINQPNLEPGVETNIYFWDFNTINQGNVANPVVSAGEAALFLQADVVFDPLDEGTDLNAIPGVVSGKALRVRNPSQHLTVKISTEGFERIIMSYAVQRSASGAQQNIIDYSLDGIQFYTMGLTENTVNVGTNYSIKSFDFSAVNALNNKQEVFLRITFKSGNEGSSGNNRIDNLLIHGTSL
jgi:hypothetical protein